MEFSFTKGIAPLTLLSDVKKAILNRHYERAGNKTYIGKGGKIAVGGIFNTKILRHEAVQKAVEAQDPDQERFYRDRITTAVKTDDGYFVLNESSDHNLLPDASINFLFNLLLGASIKIPTWYHGLFISNWCVK
jgi:hypothetical protein